MTDRSVEEIAAERAEPRFPADLEPLVVPADSIQTHPENARKGDLTVIAESLARFGQKKPVVVAVTPRFPEGVIVAGNHVYLAATEELGWDRVAATREDMTDEEAKAFLVADNRIQELGGYESDTYAALLGDLRTSGDLAGTGFTDQSVDALLKQLAPPPPDSFRRVEHYEGHAEYVCPMCQCSWSGSPRPGSGRGQKIESKGVVES